jgi:micrococcal nuclease
MVKNFLSDSKILKIDRIIDGDTVEVNGTSIRLLGMNTPERGELYYSEAKEFLEKLILNKTVMLESGKEEYDRYNRMLAYIFLNRENINLKLVEEGFANFYFPSGKDIHYNKFIEAWNICIENNKNLCEHSNNVCSKCIELKELYHKNQEISFYNKCDFDCELTNWNIKDEGRKNFIFPEFVLKSKGQIKIIVNEGLDDKYNLFWGNEEYVWTKSGDTLFLRDSAGKLVLWESY